MRSAASSVSATSPAPAAIGARHVSTGVSQTWWAGPVIGSNVTSSITA